MVRAGAQCTSLREQAGPNALILVVAARVRARLAARVLLIHAVDNLDRPLDAREVYAPGLAAADALSGRRGQLGELGERKRHLGAPEGRPLRRVVQHAVAEGARVAAVARHHVVPAVRAEDAAAVLAAAVRVGLVEQQVPGRRRAVHVRGVHFILFVVVRRAVRVDEDLEVVIVEDNLVARLVVAVAAVGDVRGEHRLLEPRADVEELVVEAHLDVRAQARRRRRADVDEVLREGHLLPRRVVELAVDDEVPVEVAVRDVRARVRGGEGAVEARGRGGRRRSRRRSSRSRSHRRNRSCNEQLGPRHAGWEERLDFIDKITVALAHTLASRLLRR